MKKKLSYLFFLISLLMLNAMPVFASDGEGGGGFNFILVIVVPLAIAIIVCISLVNSMKSVHTATSAKQYEKEGSFEVTARKDTYTHTTQEVIHHDPPDNDN